MTSTVFNYLNNPSLSKQIDDLYKTSHQEAQSNLDTLMDQNNFDNLADSAKGAMLKLEQLKQTNGQTLVDIYVRYQLIEQIQTDDLWRAHPDSFDSVEDAVEAQGISKSEYSNILDFCETIFPYLTDAGYNIQDLWETLGKSKFRELTPLLKRIITGEESRSKYVEKAFQKFVEIITGDTPAEGEDIPDTVRKQVVDHLLKLAEELPVRELRDEIRPDRRTKLQAYHSPYNDQKTVLLIIAEAEQVEAFCSRFSEHLNILQVEQDMLGDLNALQEIGSQMLGDDE